MLQHLDVPEGQTEASVRRAFDDDLGVALWGTPGVPLSINDDRDPDAPSWWTDEEDASQSFLSSMGVTFPNG